MRVLHGAERGGLSAGHGRSNRPLEPTIGFAARGSTPSRSPLEVDWRCPGTQAPSTGLRRGTSFWPHTLKLEYKAGHEDVVVIRGNVGARIIR